MNAIEEDEFDLSADDLCRWLGPTARLRDIHRDDIHVIAAKCKVILQHMKQEAPGSFSMLTGDKPRTRWPQVEYTFRIKYQDDSALDETHISAADALESVMTEIDRFWEEIPDWPGHDLVEMELDDRASSCWVVMLALFWNGEVEFDERHPIGRSISSISLRPVALPAVLKAVRESRPQVQASEIAKRVRLDSRAIFHILEILVRDGQICRGERYGYTAIESREEDEKLSA